MIGRLALVMLLALPLAGCFETIKGSVAGGECRVFERPEYAVRGKRQYDQDWIDSNVEGGIGGCGWRRPKPRPASFDAKPVTKAAIVAPKKRGLLKRVKDRVTAPWPTSPTAAVEPLPAPPIVQAPQPRDAVDELLHPTAEAR
jgi:hypothetical protein